MPSGKIRKGKEKGCDSVKLRRRRPYVVQVNGWDWKRYRTMAKAERKISRKIMWGMHRNVKFTVIKREEIL